MPPSHNRPFPWSQLPHDLRQKILSLVPLQHLFALQAVYPADAPVNLVARIRALQPLWRAWLASPIEVRNTRAYRTRAARAACTPARFVQLERLVLGASGLRGCLGAVIAEFAPSLKVLHLDDNELSALPRELESCRKLLVLDCSGNCFERFPDCVSRLPNLSFVLFSHNPRLTELSDRVADLPMLSSISVDFCALTRLPDSFVRKIVETEDLVVHAACNPFPRGYLLWLCERFPVFRRRLANSMVE